MVTENKPSSPSPSLKINYLEYDEKKGQPLWSKKDKRIKNVFKNVGRVGKGGERARRREREIKRGDVMKGRE